MTKSPKEIAMAIIQLLITSVVVCALWNLLVPEIFGLCRVSWIQALGLMVLANLTIKH